MNIDREGHTQSTIIEIYHGKKGKFRWRLTARNGRIIGSSSQGYKRRKSCIRNADDVARALLSLIIHESFEQPHPERAFDVIDRTTDG